MRKIKSQAKKTEEVLSGSDDKPVRPERKLYLILALVLLGVVGWLATRQLRQAPIERTSPDDSSISQQQAAEEFSDHVLEQLRNGQCTEIAAQTSPGFQAVITEEDWLKQCQTASSVLKGVAKEFDVEDSNTEDDITEFSYKIPASDGETYVLTTQLVYRDEKWLLQGINSGVVE